MKIELVTFSIYHVLIFSMTLFIDIILWFFVSLLIWLSELYEDINMWQHFNQVPEISFRLNF